jgi:hypothetical protein
VVEGTTADTLRRNSRLLAILCSDRPPVKGERLAVCNLLAEKAVSALERIDRDDIAFNWQLREEDRAEILAALTRSLLATEQCDLLSHLVTRALATQKVYPLPVHITALETIGPWIMGKRHESWWEKSSLQVRTGAARRTGVPIADAPARQEWLYPPDLSTEGCVW